MLARKLQEADAGVLDRVVEEPCDDDILAAAEALEDLGNADDVHDVRELRSLAGLLDEPGRSTANASARRYFGFARSVIGGESAISLATLTRWRRIEASDYSVT